MSPADQGGADQTGADQTGGDETGRNETGAETSPVVVDARGLRCPLPVIQLAHVALDSPAGTVVEVWATDPAARADVPAWCRMRGHHYLGSAVATTDATTTTDGGGESAPTHTAYRVRIVR